MTVTLLALLATGFRPPVVESKPISSFATLNARAGITVNVDAKDGDTVTGDKFFRVTVDTDQVVTKVELYVNGELRGDATSTPYKFEIDTINENDGVMTVKFVAYTDQSQKGEKTIHLTIANGVSEGADAHVKKGTQFLQDGKYDQAITEGRIALKADKKSTAARFLLARAYLQQDVFDKAQKYIEDVEADDPKNLEAIDLSSAISLKQAFNTFNKGDNTSDSLNTIKGAFADAVSNRRKFLESRLDALGSPTDSNLTAYADAAIKAGHFSEAISALTAPFSHDPKRTDLGNRLAYAQLRSGRYSEAFGTMSIEKKQGSPDAYSGAILALLYAETGADADSDAAMNDAVLNDLNNLGVRVAQASIALKRNKTSALRNLATSLAKDEGQLTEVNYMLSALNNRLRNFEAARHYFQAAVLAEPTNYDMFIEEGNEALDLGLNGKLDAKGTAFQYQVAETMFQTALLAKADSYQALTGLGLVYVLEKKGPDALKFARAAVEAQPNYAAGQYAFAAALSFNRQDDDAQKATAAAGKIDKSLDGASIPTAKEAWQYFVAGGRSPIITPPN